MNPAGSFGLRAALPGGLYYGDANWQFPKNGFVADHQDQMTGAEWENVQARIDKSATALREEIAKGGKRKTVPEWVKESLSLLVVMVGAGFIVAHYIPAAIYSETENQANDISSLKTSVDQIKQDVRDIKTEIKDTLNRALDHAMQEQGVSTSDRAKRSAIKKGTAAIELANDFGVDLDAQILSRFGQKAAAAGPEHDIDAVKLVAAHLSQAETRNDKTAEYWPAVLKFLESASAAASSFVQQPGVPPVIFHPGLKVSRTNAGTTIFSQGEITVNGPIIGKSFTFNGGIIEDVTFVRCKIIFTNLPVTMRNVTFVDCVFVLPVAENPPAYVKQVARSILASDFKKVTVNTRS